jgi:hypothetical protein
MEDLDVDHLTWVQGLDAAARSAGTRWLESVVHAVG